MKPKRKYIPSKAWYLNLNRSLGLLSTTKVHNMNTMLHTIRFDGDESVPGLGSSAIVSSSMSSVLQAMIDGYGLEIVDDEK